LLDIQDVNINVDENCVKEGTYKGKRCKYISGKLTYTLTHCVKYGVKNTDFTVYKNGTQLSRITLPITGINSTYLLLQKQLPFIENSFIYPYNNGRIEGNNNKIKVLNRVAYGYRNFQNYRNRILLYFKLKPSVKQQKQGQSHFEAA